MFGNNYPYYQPSPAPMQGYPAFYGQQMAQTQQMQQAPQAMQAAQQPQDERIWVQGEGAAMAYLVAPGGFARLWDSTQPVFYEKRSDPSGRPLPMDVYDYSRRGGNPSPASDDRLKALEERIAALEASLKGGEQA